MVSGHLEIKAAYRDETLVKDYIESRYERDPFGREVHRRQAALLDRIVQDANPQRLLEIACGPARLTVHVPRVPYACALEQSPAMLDEARQRLAKFGLEHWDLREGDAFQMPFDDASFDLVMTFKFLRHFDRQDRDHLMAGIRRVLRPGGKLVLDVVNAPACEWLLRKWGVERSWVDDFHFTIDEFEQEVRQQGFRVTSMHAVHSQIKAQYYLFSYLSRRFPALAAAGCRTLTAISSSAPYEWIAVCECE